MENFHVIESKLFLMKIYKSNLSANKKLNPIINVRKKPKEVVLPNNSVLNWLISLDIRAH